MTRIRILAEHVANKIAAGEVVERPASVVKELLENALDAGARSIRVEVESGGKRMIRVIDDGSGMVHDDALLAFERHATSKLRTADDLLSIATLGISRRGAAFDRRSFAPAAANARGAKKRGNARRIRGRKARRRKPGGLARGDDDQRGRSFLLRPGAAQFSEIGDDGTWAHRFARHALRARASRQTIRVEDADAGNHPCDGGGDDGRARLPDFRAAGARRVVRASAGSPRPCARRSRKPNSTPEERAAELVVRGFASRPEVQRSNRNGIYVFVNKRLVRDRLILHAIHEAYRNILPPAVFPAVLLFLDLPAEEVDVNVHPAKIEVRFRHPQFVHDFTRDSIRQALSRARPIPSFPGVARRPLRATAGAAASEALRRRAAAAGAKQSATRAAARRDSADGRVRACGRSGDHRRRFRIDAARRCGPERAALSVRQRHRRCCRWRSASDSKRHRRDCRRALSRERPRISEPNRWRARKA